MSEEQNGEKSVKPNYRVKERERLGEMFTHHLLPHLPPDIPRDAEGKISILSVGCGIGVEAEPLLRLVPDSTYLGIDNDSSMVWIGSTSHRDITLGSPPQFDTQDILTFDPGQKFSMVVLRQPPVGGDRVSIARYGHVIGWEDEADASVAHLADNGLLLVTTEREDYYAWLLRYMEKQGLEILNQGLNSTLEAPKDAYPDQFVIVAKKSATG
jgi:hypothetical protein